MIANAVAKINRAAAVDVWESERHVARFDPVTPWQRLRRQWTDQ
jgi:hypothetical protein